MFASVVFD